MNKREPIASEVAMWLFQQGAAHDHDGHVSLDDITLLLSMGLKLVRVVAPSPGSGSWSDLLRQPQIWLGPYINLSR